MESAEGDRGRRCSTRNERWLPGGGAARLVPMADPNRIVSDALLLTEDERVDVAVRLLDSIEALDPHAHLGDAELGDELRRRADEVASGAVEGRSWPEVRAEIERRLGL